MSINVIKTLVKETKKT